MTKRASRKSKSPSMKKSSGMTTYPTATTRAGQRRQVYEGKALKTFGGLTKDKLMESKSTGKIVSKAASAASKRQYKKNGLVPNRNLGRMYQGAEDQDFVEDLGGIKWNELLH